MKVHKVRFKVLKWKSLVLPKNKVHCPSHTEACGDKHYKAFVNNQASIEERYVFKYRLGDDTSK